MLLNFFCLYHLESKQIYRLTLIQRPKSSTFLWNRVYSLVFWIFLPKIIFKLQPRLQPHCLIKGFEFTTFPFLEIYISLILEFENVVYVYYLWRKNIQWFRYESFAKQFIFLDFEISPLAKFLHISVITSLGYA